MQTTTKRDAILDQVKDADINIQCLPEDMPYIGNCSAISECIDKENEAWITDQLESGNQWAWCLVKVSVTFMGITKDEYLGGCSYTDEDCFIACDYYSDMVDQCQESIVDQIVKIQAV